LLPLRIGIPPKFPDLNIEAMREGYPLADEQVAAPFAGSGPPPRFPL
jgi:hypothetical protein